MRELLFDTPWWFPSIVLAAGVALFIAANNRGKNGPRNMGLGLVFLAVVIAVTSYYVDTPRERAIDRTNRIVSTIQAKEWSKLAPLLDDQTQLFAFRGGSEITKAIEDRAQQHGFVSLTRINETTTSTPQSVDVVVTVITNQTAPPTFRSRWRFAYEVYENQPPLLMRVEYVPESGTAGANNDAVRAVFR